MLQIIMERFLGCYYYLEWTAISKAVSGLVQKHPDGTKSAMKRKKKIPEAISHCRKLKELVEAHWLIWI
jgi:hypothetical protein